MLSPEVWQFAPPKSGNQVSAEVSHDNIVEEVDKNPFYHSIFILCPNINQNIPSIFDEHFDDCAYYKLKNCSLDELVNIDFIDGFIKKGSITCVSIERDSNVDDVTALTYLGDFILTLSAQSYQRLGIEGQVVKQNKRQKGYCKKMPNIKQPETLESLALRGVADWVALIGENFMETFESISKTDSVKANALLASKVTILKNILGYNIPWMLYDKFADEIFRSVSYLLEKMKNAIDFRSAMSKFIGRMNVGVSLTEVLLSHNLTKLNLDGVPKMMRHVFYVKFSNLKGLESLNLGSLSGGWKTTDMEPTVISGLKALKNLRILTINYDCTDNILKALCEHCPNLQSIDVTSSKCITNDSVDYLIKFKDLRHVQLYRTGVSLEGFTKLLLKCRRMEDLGRCDELGRVLEYIDLTDSTAGPFALRKYVSRYATSHHFQLLVQFCPLIDSVSVFHNSLISDLTLLIGLPELSELKLLSCDFYADQVKQVLEVKGCNIVHLHLEHVDQLDLNALMYTSQFCPSLQHLTLYNCVLVQHTSLYTRKVDWGPFYNLEKLMCVCEATEEQLFFLLSNCMNIKFIQLGTVCRTSDRLFEKVLDKNPFLFLEELRILQSEDLTMDTVSRLLNSCVRLHILTELECWSGLTESDLEYIRNYIKINNLDLDISPLRRYEA